MSKPVLLEKDFLESSARLIRTARKKMGLTQIELANKLGVSQSCLSKFESGILMPSAVQWAIFCQMTMIPSDSIFYGLIDGLSANYLEKFDNGVNFKISSRYKTGNLLSMRFLRPFLQTIENEVGIEKLEKAFKAIKTDIDYTYILSHQANWNLVYELLEVLELDRTKVLKILELKGKNVFNQKTLGEYYKSISNENNDFSRVTAFVENIKKQDPGLALIETKIKKDRFQLVVDVKKMASWNKKKANIETCCLKDILKWEVEKVYDCFNIGRNLVFKETTNDNLVELEFIAC